MHQNQEFRFNEVLFEHRNKQYGAYVLRNESDRILTKALFIGVSVLAAVSLMPLIANALKGPNITEKIIACDFGPFNVRQVDDVEQPPVQQVQTARPKVKTEDTTVPEPRVVVKSEKNVEKIEGAVAGTTNNSEGVVAPPNTYVPPTTNIGKGPVISTPPPAMPVEKTDPNKIVDGKDLGVEANFNGGIESFRNKVMNNFDGSGFESDDVMRTTVTFIVEIDGTISNIKANGADADFNNEAIRTVKAISAKGKWIPGKNKKGESVRSYFKFPISMKFDN